MLSASQKRQDSLSLSIVFFCVAENKKKKEKSMFSWRETVRFVGGGDSAGAVQDSKNGGRIRKHDWREAGKTRPRKRKEEEKGSEFNRQSV